MIYLYHILTFLMLPAYLILLVIRIFLGKENISRIFERFGITSKVRPNGQLIWLHAASVGEANVVLTLIEAICHPQTSGHPKPFGHTEFISGSKLYPEKISFLITTGTASSAKILSAKLPKNSVHQFVPIDNILFVRKFLNHWKPSLGIFIESDLWPCLISQGSKITKLLLLNARLSDRSFKRWQNYKSIFQKIIRNFSSVVVQSAIDYDKFQSLGTGNILNYGNIKLASKKLDVNLKELELLNNHLQDRQVIVAASTHRADEKVILDSIKPLKQQYPNAMFIVILRHPSRRKEIARMAKDKGLTYNFRSNISLPNLNDDLYIVDTFGELGLFYSVAYISFIGGSFANGGHNPIEPAYFGNVIMFGPDMGNFRSIATEMVECRSAVQIYDLQELISKLSCFLSDSSHDEIVELQTNSINFIKKYRDVLDNYLNIIKNSIGDL